MAMMARDSPAPGAAAAEILEFGKGCFMYRGTYMPRLAPASEVQFRGGSASSVASSACAFVHKGNSEARVRFGTGQRQLRVVIVPDPFVQSMYARN